MGPALRRDATAATDSDSTRAASGELRLIAAMLSLAIADARRGDGDAQRWLESDAIGACVGGWHYRDVCAVLGLDAAWGRAQVAAGVPGRRGGRSMAGAGRGEVRPGRRKAA